VVGEETICAAREIIIEYTDPPPSDAAAADIDIDPTEYETLERKILKNKKQQDDLHLSLDDSANMNNVDNMDSNDNIASELQDSIGSILGSSYNTTTPTTNRLGSFSDKLRSLTPQIDERKVDRKRQEICELESVIISEFIELENYCETIKICLSRSLKVLYIFFPRLFSDLIFININIVIIII
jgi:hypothetical protein